MKVIYKKTSISIPCPVSGGVGAIKITLLVRLTITHKATISIPLQRDKANIQTFLKNQNGR